MQRNWSKRYKKQCIDFSGVGKEYVKTHDNEEKTEIGKSIL